MSLVDARGVEISPGDTCLYGFGVGRSVAMAEGVVLGEVKSAARCSLVCASADYGTECDGTADGCRLPPSVSLTASGRVRVRVVRRSYGGGEKPVVDIAPDRLVVLKPYVPPRGIALRNPPVYLPPSPLPTQDEELRAELEETVRHYTESLRETEPPSYWDDTLASYYTWCSGQLAKLRQKLRDLEERDVA